MTANLFITKLGIIFDFSVLPFILFTFIIRNLILLRRVIRSNPNHNTPMANISNSNTKYFQVKTERNIQAECGCFVWIENPFNLYVQQY